MSNGNSNNDNNMHPQQQQQQQQQHPHHQHQHEGDHIDDDIDDPIYILHSEEEEEPSIGIDDEDDLDVDSDDLDDDDDVDADDSIMEEINPADDHDPSQHHQHQHHQQQLQHHHQQQLQHQQQQQQQLQQQQHPARPQAQMARQPQAQQQPQQQLQQQRPDANNPNNELDDEPPLEGYERTNRIGQGAYGIVYKGIQRSTGSTVAIKRIPFGDATPEGGVPCNVIREISLLRELDHPNVVRLLDVNQAQPGELYLVFEYVAHDLKTFLDRNQSSSDVSRRHGLDVNTVRSFMKQILEGVGVCHTYRILHRDLKPHNLLISSDGRQLKLADFGLARLSGLPSGPYTAEVVTLWYRAPELLLGANRYCGPVDVWSIGCIFAEMATGYALFPGRSDIDQLYKIFQRRGTPNNDIWPNCTRLPYYNTEFPQWRPRPVRQFLDSFDSPSAPDLLEQLLQYDPERRLVCKAALQHQFFMET